MRNDAPYGTRVTLQLAGRRDRDQFGVAGRIIASACAKDGGRLGYSFVVPVHLDPATGRPCLGEGDGGRDIPADVRAGLMRAVDLAWRTSCNVDLVDEQGRPLLLGSIHAHPAGLSRWLAHYFQDDR